MFNVISFEKINQLRYHQALHLCQLSQRHQGGLPLPEGEHERVPDPRLTARGLDNMT